MSAWVSVPIIIAVEEEVRMQLFTTTFSVGRMAPVPRPPRSTVFKQIASSAVEIIESEITTFDDETISIPSEFTPRSRSEYRKMPRIQTRLQSCRRTFQSGAFRIVTPSKWTSSRFLENEQIFLHVPFAVITLHLHSSATRVFLLVGDFRIVSTHGRIFPLGFAIESAAAGNGDVLAPLALTKARTAGGPIRFILAQHQGGSGLQPKLDVVFQPYWTADISSWRQISDAATFGRTRINGQLHRLAGWLFDFVNRRWDRGREHQQNPEKPRRKAELSVHG